ncbi:MAG: hypothetical protein NC127_08935 [Muribaculum sp.]|nr:hypothetical protein [Muribaculum sp.]
MRDALKKTADLQKKSHEVLLKILNNIGTIGAILAAAADIVFVIIMVIGIHVDAEIRAIVIYAVVNALIGLLINVLLRYQGQKYAEIENEDLCRRFYKKQIKDKKYLTIGKWMALKTLEDVLIKGVTTAFSIFGVVYISITGSKNPIQILLTLATLILFGCFGLMAMNGAYNRFYNIQVPYMQDRLQLEDKEDNND